MHADIADLTVLSVQPRHGVGFKLPNVCVAESQGFYAVADDFDVSETARLGENLGGKFGIKLGTGGKRDVTLDRKPIGKNALYPNGQVQNRRSLLGLGQLIYE